MYFDRLVLMFQRNLMSPSLGLSELKHVRNNKCMVCPYIIHKIKKFHTHNMMLKYNISANITETEFVNIMFRIVMDI
jgi:hypothetical protein